MTITTLLVALIWMFSFKTGFARTLLFARFARTLPGSLSWWAAMSHGFYLLRSVASDAKSNRDTSVCKQHSDRRQCLMRSCHRPTLHIYTETFISLGLAVKCQSFFSFFIRQWQQNCVFFLRYWINNFTASGLTSVAWLQIYSVTFFGDSYHLLSCRLVVKSKNVNIVFLSSSDSDQKMYAFF
jgi:hypothetical protein